MRAWLLLAILPVFALAALSVACGSAWEEIPAAESDPQQAEQAAGRQEAPAESAADSSQSGQDVQAAGHDQASSESAADGFDAGEGAQSAETEERPVEMIDVQSVRERQDGAPRHPLLDAAEAAYGAWLKGVETLAFNVSADIDRRAAGIEVVHSELSTLVRLEPFAVLVESDGLWQLAMSAAMSAGVNAAELSDEPIRWQLLIEDPDSHYISYSPVDGWAYVDEEVGHEDLTGLIGANPAEFIDLRFFSKIFGCVDAVGGSIGVDVHEGEPVWVVDCEFTVGPLFGDDTEALHEVIDIWWGEITSMHLRMAVSQVSGAPLQLVVVVRARGRCLPHEAEEQDAPTPYVRAVTTLRHWNQPVDIPAPEPLVDDETIRQSVSELFAELEGSSGAGESGKEEERVPRLTAAELLERAESWANQVEEFEVWFQITTEEHYQHRYAGEMVRASRPQGAFETWACDYGGWRSRLLWNRDGIWVQEPAAFGALAWTASDPRRHGYWSGRVEDQLRLPERLEIESSQALLEIVTLVSSDPDDHPGTYFMRMSAGDVLPGDAHFSVLANMIFAAAGDRLSSPGEIEAVYSFLRDITFAGEQGEVAEQYTRARFRTSRGDLTVTISTSRLTVEGPLEFSSIEE